MENSKDELFEMIRALALDSDKADASIQDIAYKIVGEIAFRAGPGDRVSIYPELNEIFDLAADVELGPEHTTDFDQKAETLKALIKNI